ncbi:MAG: leucine-rich repeat domain-containing protein, partial [Bacteroidales bacterium]|nr:leucine-rich repeat domain-containing protein [Bacteroidales bacterium]
MKNNCTLSDGILTFRDGVTVALVDIIHYLGEVREIILPEGMKTIPDGAFSFFGNLSRVSLPESLEEIGEGAFECCSSLKHLFIPKNVKKIGEGAFNFCSSLEKIEVAKGNKTFTSEGNCLLSAGGKTLIRGGRSYVIPSTVKVIGERAFHSRSPEGEFVSPGTVTAIGAFAFADNPFL